MCIMTKEVAAMAIYDNPLLNDRVMHHIEFSDDTIEDIEARNNERILMFCRGARSPCRERINWIYDLFFSKMSKIDSLGRECVKIPFTQTDIASYGGMSRQRLSEYFKEKGNKYYRVGNKIVKRSIS